MVGMSGGVDSSVCAALLKEAGYNVSGVTLRLYDGEDYNAGLTKTCCSLPSQGHQRPLHLPNFRMMRKRFWKNWKRL